MAAAGWNLLQLVMGLSYEDIQKLPVWQTHNIVMPQSGHRREHHGGKDRHRDGLGLHRRQLGYSGMREVSHSRVHVPGDCCPWLTVTDPRRFLTARAVHRKY